MKLEAIICASFANLIYEDELDIQVNKISETILELY